jgi:polyphosphate kinase 2 PPK2
LAAPIVERAFVESSVMLLKYWLEVSPAEQTRRLEDRIDDGRKTWKLSPMDLDSYGHWYDYSRARDEMFAATDGASARWYVVKSDDKRLTRLNIIIHLLSKIPYEAIKRGHIKLPKQSEKRRLRRPIIARAKEYCPRAVLTGDLSSCLAETGAKRGVVLHVTAGSCGAAVSRLCGINAPCRP